MIKLAPLILLLFLTGCGLKSENELRQQFAQNKDVIGRILEMQNQDPKVVRIAPDFTRLDNNWSWPRKDIGFSQERWNQYRVLFKEAEITDGIQKDQNYVWYFVSSEGLSIGGTSRGFVHVEKQPELVVSHFNQCPKVEGICYIDLGEHWYIFQWTV